MNLKLGNLIYSFKNLHPASLKLNFEKKANREIEKVISLVVNKILGKDSEKISEEVKKEIIQNFVQHNKGKNVLPIVKYINSVIVANVPKDIQSVKNFRKNLANTLVKDACDRLESKK